MYPIRMPKIRPLNIRPPRITAGDYGFESGPNKDPKRTLSISEKKVVYARDKGRCRVCDKKVPFEQAEFGHDRAHSKGGRTTIKNALTLHPHCNTLMRTKSLAKIRAELGLSTKSAKIKGKKKRGRRRGTSKPFGGFVDYKPPKLVIPRFY